MLILENPSISDVNGIKATGVSAGIKNNGKLDMALIYSEVEGVAAAAFTTNRVQAAPIKLDKEHIKNNITRAIVVNSGNANACTGEQGYKNALDTCKMVAEKLEIKKEEVLVQSTGVIGVDLPMDNIKNGIELLVEDLGEKGNIAAEAIMTTDLTKKVYGVEIELSGKKVKIIGMAKGSGMIHPNMGTMLAFVVTDANISKEMLQVAHKEVVEDSYNMISVDGDTSTNDMACVLANALAHNEKITSLNNDFYKFKDALKKVSEELAKKIAEDGEGATKFLEVEVTGAKDKKNAQILAKSLITSNLAKCAFFGSDANWGRILCAMGYSGGEFHTEKVTIDFLSGDYRMRVAEKGRGVPFDEKYAKELLLNKNIKVEIMLEDGEASAKAWGCDLSYDYVKINGDYRS